MTAIASSYEKLGQYLETRRIIHGPTDEIVAPRSERLYDRHIVPPRLAITVPSAQAPHQYESRRPHDAEVQDHWHKDTEYRPKIV